MKITELTLVDHLQYALDDIKEEMRSGDNEVAFNLIEELQLVVKRVADERANLEKQMHEFYTSDDTHLDDEDLAEIVE